jgi:hypothetical protein
MLKATNVKNFETYSLKMSIAYGVTMISNFLY